MDWWGWALVAVGILAFVVWRKSASVRKTRAELVTDSLRLEMQLLQSKQAVVEGLDNKTMSISKAEMEIQQMVLLFRQFHERCSRAFMEMHPVFVESFSRMESNIAEARNALEHAKSE